MGGVEGNLKSGGVGVRGFRGFRGYFFLELRSNNLCIPVASQLPGSVRKSGRLQQGVKRQRLT